MEASEVAGPRARTIFGKRSDSRSGGPTASSPMPEQSKTITSSSTRCRRTFIPYGAPLRRDQASDRLAGLGLEPGGYHLVVARIEPENNVHTIVAAYVSSGANLAVGRGW